MAEEFKVGDRVSWNSEAGHVSGTIIRVQSTTSITRATLTEPPPNSPQYEIKSSKTNMWPLTRARHSRA